MQAIPFPYELTPSSCLARLADLPWPVLLESARFHPQRGRYSYLSADPRQTWTVHHAQPGLDPFAPLRSALIEAGQQPAPIGPPFQGGIIGLLSYELGHCWEQLPRVPADDFTTPPLAAGLFDWCLAWDHLQQQAWLISPVPLTETGPTARRINEYRNRLLAPANASPNRESTEITQNETSVDAPATSLQADQSLRAGLRRDEYLVQVARVIEYIRAGDIYQANLSRKLEYAFPAGPLVLYGRIREMNPAPFSAFFQPEPDWALVSASPEQFLQVDSGRVITRPIKGTRRRWSAGDIDLLQGVELRAAEKDRAENTMIVDLLRNDLSRVCQIGSVKVPRWCELESFEKVHHLVSEVTGTLRPDRDAWDLLTATFPGGSITGAPKIRAMQIIAELEQSARGAYCGSLIAVGWQGKLQSSILIRTLTWKNGRVQCPVGGGIVADSLPDSEYEETVHKSAGLIA